MKKYHYLFENVSIYLIWTQIIINKNATQTKNCIMCEYQIEVSIFLPFNSRMHNTWGKYYLLNKINNNYGAFMWLYNILKQRMFYWSRLLGWMLWQLRISWSLYLQNLAWTTISQSTRIHDFQIEFWFQI